MPSFLLQSPKFRDRRFASSKIVPLDAYCRTTLSDAESELQALRTVWRHIFGITNQSLLQNYLKIAVIINYIDPTMPASSIAARASVSSTAEPVNRLLDRYRSARMKLRVATCRLLARVTNGSDAQWICYIS